MGIRTKRLGLGLLLGGAVLLAFTGGCKEEGAAEKAGKDVDKAGEDAGKTADKAVEDANKALEGTGD